MPSNEVLRQRLHGVARFANGHRLLVYFSLSLITLAAVITNALKNYSNFYSVAIYLSKSSRSVLALANFGILIALLCGHVVQRIFFGALRANEIERLYDRLWFFITESLLAFTIFRDEFDTSFAFMFGFLLFVKAFHWLASDRIEWMDQRPYPGPPLLFHLRMVALFIILWSIDLLMFLFTVEHTLSVGVGGMVLFASEYGILVASVLNIIAKYALSAYELRRAGQRGGENAPPWENKSMWVFYNELATDFLKLTIYLLFFTVIITFYGLPLNIVRDVYITARSFISRLKALHRYQTATRNMDQRYPNATEEELSGMSDRTCIICREEMVFHDPQIQGENRDGPNMAPKKLPCAHIFHFYCLRSWLERQQSCPTCRRTVLDNEVPRTNPPPAAPGAVPQLPNNAVAPQQAGNNPLGNPLGFANRLFGPPVQGANNGPFIPAQHNQPDGQGGAHDLRLLIQYELQYQPPHGQAPGIHSNPQHNQGQRPLTPVPPFAGFQGPNEAWQPWPANRPNWDGSSFQQTETPRADSNTHSQVEASTTSVDPRSASPVESESDSDFSIEEGLSPREAALAAALQRLGGVLSKPLPTKTIRSSQTEPSPADPSGSDEPLERDQNQSPYPRLIPIYNLTGSSQPSPNSAIHAPYHQPFSLSPVPPLLQQNRFANRFEFLNADRSAGPSSGNPSRLTDGQLATMDRLTREAIDERLRVLEGVSNTIYGCIDDLMRMRSALPGLRPSGSRAGTHVGSNSLHAHTASTGTSRQEEKRPERYESHSEEVPPVEERL